MEKNYSHNEQTAGDNSTNIIGDSNKVNNIYAHEPESWPEYERQTVLPLRIGRVHATPLGLAIGGGATACTALLGLAADLNTLLGPSGIGVYMFTAAFFPFFLGCVGYRLHKDERTFHPLGSRMEHLNIEKAPSGHLYCTHVTAKCPDCGGEMEVRSRAKAACKKNPHRHKGVFDYTELPPLE